MSFVRGDLDWVVSKAMEKDRNRRYESAGAFRQDIERFLVNDPIEARPPSKSYRLNRFLRKNRTAIGIAAAFAAVLVSATCFSVWKAYQATESKNVAVEALESEKAALAAEKIAKIRSETVEQIARESLSDDKADKFMGFIGEAMEGSAEAFRNQDRDFRGRSGRGGGSRGGDGGKGGKGGGGKGRSSRPEGDDF